MISFFLHIFHDINALVRIKKTLKKKHNYSILLLAGAHHKFSSEESSSINFHLHIIYLCPHILIELCMTLPKALAVG